jgi:PEP-CTERM motif
LTRATAVDFDSSGVRHDYLLTPPASESPVPEPTTLAFVGIVAGGLGLRWIRSSSKRRRESKPGLK